VANLKLYLLGPTWIKSGEKDLEVRPRKALALLIYLAITAERQLRDFLAALLWPNAGPSRAISDLIYTQNRVHWGA
jgi:DNA-binding SARP family transcriptional activator